MCTVVMHNRPRPPPAAPGCPLGCRDGTQVHTPTSWSEPRVPFDAVTAPNRPRLARRGTACPLSPLTSPPSAVRRSKTPAAAHPPAAEPPLTSAGTNLAEQGAPRRNHAGQIDTPLAGPEQPLQRARNATAGGNLTIVAVPAHRGMGADDARSRFPEHPYARVAARRDAGRRTTPQLRDAPASTSCTHTDLTALTPPARSRRSARCRRPWACGRRRR